MQVLCYRIPANLDISWLPTLRLGIESWLTFKNRQPKDWVLKTKGGGMRHPLSSISNGVCGDGCDGCLMQNSRAAYTFQNCWRTLSFREFDGGGGSESVSNLWQKDENVWTHPPSIYLLFLRPAYFWGVAYLSHVGWVVERRSCNQGGSVVQNQVDATVPFGKALILVSLNTKSLGVDVKPLIPCLLTYKHTHAVSLT